VKLLLHVEVVGMQFVASCWGGLLGGTRGLRGRER